MDCGNPQFLTTLSRAASHVTVLRGLGRSDLLSRGSGRYFLYLLRYISARLIFLIILAVMGYIGLNL